MIRPRILARFLAWVGGYFWLPCPVCGEPFAGFEHRFSTPPSGIMIDGHMMGTCPKQECIERGQREFSKAMDNQWEVPPTFVR